MSKDLFLDSFRKTWDIACRETKWPATSKSKSLQMYERIARIRVRIVELLMLVIHEL